MFLILCFSTSRAQTVVVEAKNLSLNNVFVQMRDDYDVQFSFNDRQLSDFRVTVNQEFTSPEEAIVYLITPFPLTLEKRGPVFLIKRIKEPKRPTFLFNGIVKDQHSGEPLPYSHIVIGDYALSTDLKGSFSYRTQGDSLLHLVVSHLGHYLLDTIVGAGENHLIELTPSSYGLKEIIVENSIVDNSTQIGYSAGVMQLNHQIANYLPGNDDNSVFNLLRLHPGILAAGEQSNGMIIWGSYEGHSQVLFDGFTLWGLKNFNDNISSVNPLVAKNINVLKGGYDVTMGNRVGGIVNVVGKNGTSFKPRLNLSINNVTMNGMFETPVSPNSSFLLAFRQTYYNLYDPNDLNIFGQNTSGNGNADTDTPIDLIPDYDFRDINAKFSTRNENGDLFYVSVLGGEDLFDYDVMQERPKNSISRTKEEKSNQQGASAFYGKNWANGNSSSITLAYSGLNTVLSDRYVVTNIRTNNEVYRRNSKTTNEVSEYSLNIDNRLALNEQNQVSFGAGFNYTDVGLREDSADVNLVEMNAAMNRVHLFVQDELDLPGRISLKGGLRIDVPMDVDDVFIQPRLSASAEIMKGLRLNAAWGIYNQFVTKTSVVDDLGNYRYIWTNANNEEIPVLEAMHWVSGLSYYQHGFTFSVEMYVKQTDHLTRFKKESRHFTEKVYSGESRSKGIDFFVKKEFAKHAAWITYSLSCTEEKFEFFPEDVFVRAPHDQHHEVKIACLFNFSPFFLSGNYVFGSGFPMYEGAFQKSDYSEPDYNRMDVSFIYKLPSERFYSEIGLSVLNVLDHENIKYSSFERVPVSQTNAININTEAMPFSPRLHFKLSF